MQHVHQVQHLEQGMSHVGALLQTCSMPLGWETTGR